MFPLSSSQNASTPAAADVANAKPVEHESEFVRTLVERLETRQARHSWKSGDDGDPHDIYQKNLTWGAQARRNSADGAVPTFAALARGNAASTILYALNLTGSGGVFSWDAAQRNERRYFHREALQVTGLAAHPRTGEIVYSTHARDGTADIELIDAAGRRQGTITAGESIDLAPSFDPRADAVIVYQSAGVARTAEGHFAGAGPFAINRLDYRSGKLDTIIENPECDYLCPVVGPDGCLLAIRRPHRDQRRASFPQVIKDVVLAPWRIGMAVFGFVNAFTAMFGKEHLQSVGGPGRQEGRERRGVFLQGQWIAFDQSSRHGKTPGGGAAPRGLVPDDWQLVRLHLNGGEVTGETILASGVASYALASDGTLFTSDGRSIWRHAQAARPDDATKPERARILTVPLVEEFTIA